MSDRMHSAYNMLPPNFAPPGLHPQQAQQQQLQQPQMDGQASVGGLTNPEHSRMWTQMHQHYMKNNMGNDQMNNVPVNQVTDMLRAQQMARQQMGQSQPNAQQQFTLNGGMQPTHQGFDPSHTPQAPQNFAGGSAPLNSMQRIQAAFQANRNQPAPNANNYMQALNGANPSVMSRQLELMGLAHNQQPQNGLTNNPAQRTNQQSLHPPSHNMGGQPIASSSAGFPSSQAPRMSPIPPNAQVGPSAMLPQQQMGIPGVDSSGPATARQLLTTYQTLKGNLQTEEQKRLAIESSNQPEAHKHQQKTASLQRMDGLKRHLAMVTARLTQMKKEQGGMAGNMVPPPKLLPNGRTNPAFLTYVGQRPDLFTKQSQPPLNIQPSPSLRNQSIPAQDGAPQRQIPTPNQSMLSAPQPSPNLMRMSPHLPSGTPQLQANVQQRQNGGAPPQQSQAVPQVPGPVSEAKFAPLWQHVAAQNSFQLNERWMSFDGRQISLHKLHTIVFTMGGYNNVTSNDLWSVVGGRLGFVQFPGGDHGPDRCGPAAAQHLQQLYQQFMVPFDQMYIKLFMDIRKKTAMAQSQASLGQQSHPSQPQTNPPNPSQPGQVQIYPFQTNEVMMKNMLQKGHQPFLEFLYKLLHTSEAELRQQGHPEIFINWFEQHRDMIRRQYQTTEDFRNGLGAKTLPTAVGGGPSMMQPSMNGQRQAPPSSIPGQQQQLSQLQLHHQQQQQQQRFNAMNGNMQQLASAGQGPSQPNPAQQNLLSMQMAMNNMNGQQQSQIMGRQMGPNGMMNGGQPQMHPQHLQGRPPQQGGPPAAQPRRPIQRPSPDQLQTADKAIKELQQQWMMSQRGGANFAYINVPEHQRTQYNEALGRLSTAVKDFEHKMPMYFAISQSLEQIKKLVIITLSTKFQEHQCSQNSNRYIVDLETLRGMLSTIQNANNGFMQMVTAISVMEAQQRNAGGGGPPPQHGMHALSPMPPHQQPPLPQRSPAPRPIPAQPTRKPSQTFPPGLTPVVSSATPPQSAATPSAQAVTPSMAAAASPQTPKSPKTKAAPKKTRRKTTKAAAPSPAETSTAAAATPATPADVKVNAKRAREEEGPSAGEASTSAPSPKRVKADPDGPPSDTQAQREKDAENAASGSDEDLIAFLENITQYTNTTNPEGSQASVGSSELGDVLSELLKAYPSTDVEASGEGSSSSALGGLELDGSHPPSPPSGQLHELDPFAEYFDLSSFDDVSVSKAPTPDLVQTSSTNPSPESGSEADAAGHLTAMHHVGNGASPHIAAVGLDDSDEDPLRLGIWKEIDGGEAAFYQASGWKWDAPMSTSEHPWAISS